MSRLLARLLIAGMAIYLMLAPLPAIAAPPTVENVQVHVNLGDIGSCGAFSVLAQFDVTRRITTFYRDSTPIRQVIHADIPGKVTNSVTGKSLPTKGVRNITRDLLTNAVQSTGTNVHVIVPGEGTVLLSAGMFRIDDEGNLVREVGRQDSPITPKLCAALANS